MKTSCSCKKNSSKELTKGTVKAAFIVMSLHTGSIRTTLERCKTVKMKVPNFKVTIKCSGQLRSAPEHCGFLIFTFLLFFFFLRAGQLEIADSDISEFKSNLTGSIPSLLSDICVTQARLVFIIIDGAVSVIFDPLN